MEPPPNAVTVTESRPGEILANLHDSAAAEREYLFASYDANDQDLILVAWHDQRAIGYIATTDQQAGPLLVWEHVVVPGYRGQGIGRRLLLEVAKRTIPSSIIVIDPIGQLDPERVNDYYSQLGFATVISNGQLSAKANDVTTALGEQREDATTVATVLARKGPGVITVAPSASLHKVLELMNDERIGAVVASSDGARVEGILSERDLLAGIAKEGITFLDRTIQECSTNHVVTATVTDLVSTVMATMTSNRIRHLPITDTGALVGILSVGDLLLFRLQELDAGGH